MKPLNPIKLVWKKQTKTWGYAIPEKRTIVIDPRLDDRTTAEIIIHEAGHCAFPYLEEDPINEHGRQAADLLIRAGFTRQHEGD